MRLLEEQDSPFDGKTKAQGCCLSKHTSPAPLPGVAGSVKGSQADSITAARSSLFASDAEVTLWHDARRSDIQPSERTDMREKLYSATQGCARRGGSPTRVHGRMRVCALSHAHSYAHKRQGETNSVLVVVLFNVAQLYSTTVAT